MGHHSEGDEPKVNVIHRHRQIAPVPLLPFFLIYMCLTNIETLVPSKTINLLK